MPHKRNPARSERICGLARVVRANAQVGLENVALWHERDISHSSAERVIIADSTTLLDYMIFLFTGIIDGLVVDPERMARNLEMTGGQIYSQAVMLALIEEGMNRQEAYELIRAHCHRASDSGQHLQALLESDPRVGEHLSREALSGYFSHRAHLAHVDTGFERLGL